MAVLRLLSSGARTGIRPAERGDSIRKGRRRQVDRFDVIVIGSAGGESAAGRLLDAGRRVALIERELIGGECAYWACIPSKTLLRGPEARAAAGRVAGVSTPSLDWAGLRDYRDYMIRGRRPPRVDRPVGGSPAGPGLRGHLGRVARAVDEAHQHRPPCRIGQRCLRPGPALPDHHLKRYTV
jgi:choline dehydrogenase-like flavoprotein